jgi:mRNA interferase MazF
MKEGDIVLTTIPQDIYIKLRPALVIKVLPRHNDYLLCGISTKLQDVTPGIDFVIEETHPSFATSGLKAASAFRLAFIAVVPDTHVIGRIGFISENLLNEIKQHLTNYILS